MKKKSKSLGIVGCGSVVRKFYIPFIHNLEEIELRYITDVNQKSAEELSSILNCEYIHLDKLIKKADIIIIATPPNTHYELIKKALKKDKIVVCEKPFVGSLSEAKELINLSEKQNSQLYIAHIRRCFPSVILARKLISTGIMGELKEIFLQEGGKFNYNSQSNYVYENKLGGVLLDTGSHTIDTALFITKLDEKNITNIAINKFWVSSKEPSHEIKVQLSLNTIDKPIKLNIHLSRLRVLANKISFIFENGEINLPAEFSNYIKVTGKSSSSRLYSNDPYNDFMDLFPIQYHHMFNKNSEMNNNFKAERFTNLTNILETILNNN
jgi:hypothetical protein